MGRLHLAAALLVCQALTCATAATFGNAPAPAISRAAPAELYGALEVGGYAIKPAGYIKSVPGMVRSSLRQFRTGISGMWNNFGEVRRIQKRVKQTGVPASYPELLLIRKSGEDTTKFLQTGTVWFVAPELFCAALYFFPRLVPSTFETDAGRAKRYRAMSRLRTKSVVKLITHVEDQWVQSDGWARAAKKAEAQLHASLARQVLTGGSEFAGLRPLTPYVLQEHTEAALTPRKQRKQMRKSLDKLPTPLLNAACGVNLPPPSPPAPPHSAPLHSTPLHYTPPHSTQPHSTPLHSTPPPPPPPSALSRRASPHPPFVLPPQASSGSLTSPSSAGGGAGSPST